MTYFVLFVHWEHRPSVNYVAWMMSSPSTAVKEFFSGTNLFGHSWQDLMPFSKFVSHCFTSAFFAFQCLFVRVPQPSCSFCTGGSVCQGSSAFLFSLHWGFNVIACEIMFVAGVLSVSVPLHVTVYLLFIYCIHNNSKICDLAMCSGMFYD